MDLVCRFRFPKRTTKILQAARTCTAHVRYTVQARIEAHQRWLRGVIAHSHGLHEGVIAAQASLFVVGNAVVNGAPVVAAGAAVVDGVAVDVVGVCVVVTGAAGMTELAGLIGCDPDGLNLETSKWMQRRPRHNLTRCSRGRVGWTRSCIAHSRTIYQPILGIVGGAMILVWVVAAIRGTPHSQSSWRGACARSPRRTQCL